MSMQYPMPQGPVYQQPYPPTAPNYSQPAGVQGSYLQSPGQVAYPSSGVPGYPPSQPTYAPMPPVQQGPLPPAPYGNSQSLGMPPTGPNPFAQTSSNNSTSMLSDLANKKTMLLNSPMAGTPQGNMLLQQITDLEQELSHTIASPYGNSLALGNSSSSGTSNINSAINSLVSQTQMLLNPSAPQPQGFMPGSVSSYPSVKAPQVDSGNMMMMLMMMMMSKNKKKSDIVSMSPDKIAQMTTKQLAKIKPAQLQALSTSQIQAFSLDQLGSLTQAQMASFSAAQIASLSSLQLSGLSSSHTSKLEAGQISQLTPEQLNALSNDAFSGLALNSLSLSQYNGLSTNRATTLTSRQVGQLNATLLNAMTDTAFNQLNPGYFTGGQISGLATNRLQQIPASALSNWDINSISTVAFNQLTSEQLQQLSTSQLNTLSAGHLNTLFDKKYFTNAGILNLAPTQLNKLNQTNFQSFSSSLIAQLQPMHLNQLDEAHLKYFTSAQIEALSAVQLNGMNPSQMSVFPSNLLTMEQINGLDTIHFGKLNLGLMTPNTLNSLGISLWQGATQAQIQQLTAQVLNQLSASTLQKINASQFSVTQLNQLSPVQLNTLTETQWQQLTAQQLNGLSQLQFQAMSPTNLAKLLPTQFKSLGSTQMAYLTQAQTQGLLLTQLNALDSTQFSKINAGYLSLAQIGGLSPTHFATLNAGQFSPEQVAYFIDNNLAAINGTSLPKLSAAALNGIDVAHFQKLDASKLTTTQLNSLAPTRVQELSQAQARALNQTQLNGTSTATFGALKTSDLTATQLNSLDDVHFGYLSQAPTQAISVDVLNQMDVLKFSKINAGNLSLAQLGGLAPTHFATLNAGQFSPEQVAYFIDNNLAAINGTSLPKLSAIALNGIDKSHFQKLDASKLSAAQLNGLEATRVQELSQAQIQALSAAQLNGINVTTFGALKVSDLTATQLNSLDDVHFGYLTQTQTQSIDVANLNQMDVLKFSKINAGNLSLSQLGGLAPTHFATLNAGQFSPEQVAYFIDNNLAAINGTSLPKLSAAALNGIDAAHFQKLDASKLTTAQLNALSPTRVQELSQLQARALSQAQLNGTNATTFGALKVADLTATQLNSLDDVHFGYLSQAQTQSIAVDSLNQMDVLKFSKINAGNLSLAQLGGLSPTHFATLNAGQFSPEQVAYFIDNNLAAINGTSVPELSAVALNGIDAGHFQKLDASKLTTTQLNALTPATIGYLSANQIQALPADNLNSLTSEFLNSFNVSLLSTNQVKQLQGPTLATLLSQNRLTESQLAALTGPQLSLLSTEQLQALSPTAVIAKLDTTQLNTMSDIALSSLKPEQISALNTTMLTQMLPDKFKALKLAPLSAAFLNSLEGTVYQDKLNLSGITVERMNQLNVSLIDKLTTAQIQQIDGAVLNTIDSTRFNTIALTDFSEEQLNLLTRVSALNVSQMTVGEINALTPTLLTKILGSSVQSLSPTILNTIDPTKPALGYFTKYLSFDQLGTLDDAHLDGLNLNSLSDWTWGYLPAATAKRILTASRFNTVASDVLTKTPSFSRSVANMDPAELNKVSPLNPLFKILSGSYSFEQLGTFDEAHLDSLNLNLLGDWTWGYLPADTAKRMLTASRMNTLAPDIMTKIPSFKNSLLNVDPIELNKLDPTQSLFKTFSLYFSYSQLENLDPTHVAALDITKISSGTWWSMPPATAKHILTAQQLNTLTPEQVPTLNNALRAIDPLELNKMPLNSLVFKALSGVITPQQMELMDDVHLQALDISKITRDTWYSMPAATVKRVLTANQLNTLSATQVPTLWTAIQYIDPIELNKMALDSPVFKALSASLTSTQMGLMDDAHLQALDISKIDRNTWYSMSANTVKRLVTANQLNTLSATQVPTLWTAMQYIDPVELNKMALDSPVYKALSGGLGVSQLNLLDDSHLQALDITKISNGIWYSLSAATAKRILTANQLNTLLPTQVPTLGNAVASIDPLELNKMATDSPVFVALTSRFTANQINNLDMQHYKGLIPAEVSFTVLGSVNGDILNSIYTGSALDSFALTSAHLSNFLYYSWGNKLTSATLNQMDVTKPNFSGLSKYYTAAQVSGLDQAHILALDPVTLPYSILGSLSDQIVNTVYTGAVLDSLAVNDPHLTNFLYYSWGNKLTSATLNQMDVTKPNFSSLSQFLTTAQVSGLDQAHVLALNPAVLPLNVLGGLNAQIVNTIYTGAVLDSLASTSQYITKFSDYQWGSKITSMTLNQMDVAKPNFKLLTKFYSAVQINGMDDLHLKALDSTQISSAVWSSIQPSKRQIIDPTRI